MRARVAIPPLIALFGIAATVAACTPAEERAPQPIDGWSVADDVVHLWVDTCNGEPEADVVETELEVRITIVSTRRSPGGACQDSLTVDLAAPLGDRRLIDGATGRAPEPMEG